MNVHIYRQHLSKNESSKHHLHDIVMAVAAVHEIIFVNDSSVSIGIALCTALNHNSAACVSTFKSRKTANTKCSE